MEKEMTDAVIAKGVFETLMARHQARPAPTRPAEYSLLYEKEGAEIRRAEAEAILDALGHALEIFTKSHNFQYEKPTLTEDGVQLIRCSWDAFMKKYTDDFRDSLRGPMPGVVLYI